MHIRDRDRKGAENGHSVQKMSLHVSASEIVRESTEDGSAFMSHTQTVSFEKATNTHSLLCNVRGQGPGY